MSDTVIEVRGASRRYGGVDVLADVDLDVYRGEILGLIGPNGGGKSTLLLLLAGLITPTRGTVSVLGVPAHELARAESGQLGLITAVPGLYPLLTGVENLRFFGRLYGLRDDAIDARAAPVLTELGLDPRAMASPVGAWSSGMLQKLSLARALMLSPQILLLDEPTSNLDPLSAYTLFRSVRTRADHGMTAVLATHDLHAAERMCDRVAVVDGGILEVVTLTGERTPPPQGRLHRMFPEQRT